MPTCLEIVIYVHIICLKNILNQLQHWNHEHQHHRQSRMSQESPGLPHTKPHVTIKPRVTEQKSMSDAIAMLTDEQQHSLS